MDEGEEAVLALRGDGDVVGEFAGELTGYRTAPMYALEDVLAVLIPHRRFSAYLDSCPPAAQASSWPDQAPRGRPGG